MTINTIWYPGMNPGIETAVLLVVIKGWKKGVVKNDCLVGLGVFCEGDFNVLELDSGCPECH